MKSAIMASTLTRFILGFSSVALLAPISNARSLQLRDFITPDDLPAPWTSLGCYIDVGRTLTDGGYDDNIGMTAESCVAYCSAAGYHYAGTEYFHECFCGDILTTGGVPASASDCNTPCVGDPTEACGGPNRLSLFWDGQSPPQINSGEDGWSFIGCYAEGTTGRTLPYYPPTQDESLMTVDICNTFCQTNGYIYSGLEYGGECYCGNDFENFGGPATDGLTGCSMLCNGNSSEYCGGPDRLEMYEFGASTATQDTASSSSTISATSSSPPVVSTSLSVVSTASSSVVSTSSSSSSAAPSSSSMSSSIVPTTSPSVSSAPSVVSTTSSSTTSASSTSAAASVPQTLGIKQTVGDYTYQGCYTEGVGVRALSASSYINYETMTIEDCANACSDYTYFGVEYYGECYCGNSIDPTAGLAPNQGDCDFICPGDQYEYCGAGDRLDMYKKGATSGDSTSGTSTSSSTSAAVSPSPTAPSISSTSSSSTSSSTVPTSSPFVSSTPPALSTTSSSTTSASTSPSAAISVPQTLGIKQIVGDYTFQGCWTEGEGVRALSASTYIDYVSMTLEDCANSCSDYTYFGVEYYGECYCGNSIDPTAGLAPNQGDCDFICPGDQYEYCGAGDRLEMYKRDSTTGTSSSSSAAVPSSSADPPAGSPTSATTTSSSLDPTSSSSSPSSSSLFSSSSSSTSTSQALASVCSPSVATASTSQGIYLGVSKSFAALSYASITNVGPSMLVGDIGTTGTSITGFPPGTYSGTEYIAAAASAALTDGNNVYNKIAALPGATVLTGNLAGQTLTPGLYKFSSSANIAANGELTLLGTGDASEQWIFQIGSTLVTGTTSNILLTDALACNVFWQVGSSATLGVGSTFQGTILAAISVTVDTAATVNGGAFALGGSVTIQDSAISAEYCAPVPVLNTISCSATSTSSSSSSSSSVSTMLTISSSSSSTSSALTTSSSSSSATMSSTSSSSSSSSSTSPSSSSTAMSSTSSSSSSSSSTSPSSSSSSASTSTSSSSSSSVSSSTSVSSTISSSASPSCTSVPRANNIIPDPGFEDGTSNSWHFIDAEVVSAEAKSGVYSAELNGNDGDYSIVYNFIPYTAFWGQTLYLSYAAKFTGDSTASCYFQALTGSSTIQEIDNLETFDWQYFTATYSIPDGDESEGFAIALMCTDTSASLYIDDIYFGPVASQTTCTSSSSSSIPSSTSSSSSGLSSSSSSPSSTSSSSSSISSSPSTSSSLNPSSTSSSFITTISSSPSSSSTSSSLPSSSCSSGPRPSNIIPDPNFEDTTSTAWHFIDSSITSTESISGLYSGELTGNDGAYSIIYDFIPYTAYWGETLYLSYAAKFTGDNAAGCYFQALTGSSTIQEVDNLETFDWQYYSASYFVSEGDDSEGFAFSLICSDPSALLYIDDIYFGPVASETTCSSSSSSSAPSSTASSSAPSSTASSSAPSSTASSSAPSSTASSSAPSSTASSSAPSSTASSSAPSSTASSSAPSSTASSSAPSSTASSSAPSSTSSTSSSAPSSSPSDAPSSSVSLCSPSVSTATPLINLGAASNYAVLSYATITNTGLTVVDGDIGTTGTSITGFPPGIYSGTEYIADTATSALTAGTNAYEQLAAMGGSTLLTGDLDGMSLGPGVYKFSSSASLSSGEVLTLVGSASDTWIFQIGSTLITGADSTILLTDDAQACNVYWQVGSSATLGVGSVFQGHLLAAISVTANTNSIVQGSLFGLGGSVTLDSIVIDNQYCAPAVTTSTCGVASTSSSPTSTSSSAPSSTSPSPPSSTSTMSSSLPTSTLSSSSSTSSAYMGPPTPSIVPSALNGQCVFIGCYSEGDGTRALSSDELYQYNVGTGMTVEKCAAYCGESYLMFGVEYSGECYCGNTLAGGSIIRPLTECYMTCDGAPLEFCGGPNRLNVYSCGAATSSSSPVPVTTSSSSTSTAAPISTAANSVPTPSIVQSVYGYEYTGCYTEATNSRALAAATYVNYNTMTVAICAAYCGPTYGMFGVEWSGECYCGNTLQPGSVKVSDAECSSLCDGNNLEYCGGGSRLNLYTSTSGTTTTTTTTTSSTFPNIGTYSYYGCQTEATNARALSAKTTAYDGMTLESCASDCAGYTYWGTEYGRECYCGNSFSAGSQTASQADCYFPCEGNGAEICGAGQRLSVYTTSTPVTVTLPSNPEIVGAYSYYGCMTEGANSRALQSKTTAYDTMTLESCAADCAGYEFFGTEYSRECYCGNSFAPGAVSTPESNCQNTDFLCAGNDLEFCGGSRILSVYQVGGKK